MRELTKTNFTGMWGSAGYREKFEVYSRPDKGGVSEKAVVDKCLRPFLNKNHTCLEIGCGGGFWIDNYLSDGFKEVIGIDVVPITGTENRKSFRFIEVPDKDYSCYGVEDGSIDFVWSFGVFCHIRKDKIAEYVKSAHRVLKDGGMASLFFPCNDRRGSKSPSSEESTWESFSIKEAMLAMEDAGFTDIYDPIPSMRDLQLIGTKKGDNDE